MSNVSTTAVSEFEPAAHSIISLYPPAVDTLVVLTSLEYSEPC